MVAAIPDQASLPVTAATSRAPMLTAAPNPSPETIWPAISTVTVRR